MKNILEYPVKLKEAQERYDPAVIANYLYEILPISALIGSVIGLGTLASNSELIVMRSVGISLWRIVGWVIRSAMLLVILSFALSQWIIPYTTEKADSIWLLQ